MTTKDIALTINEGRDLDHLLYSILKLPETHGSNVIQLNVAHKYFLNDRGEFYVVDIVYKALSYEPRVIIANTEVGIKTVIWPTPLLEDFLRKGGFSKIAENQDYQKRQKEEIEKLNLEKLRYDVKNSKRVFKTYWWTFGMASIGLIVSLILLVLRIRTGK